jgi:hypothetical protein
LIGGVVSDPLIATLGLCLGRGVIISILGVLLVLPTLLYIFDNPLLKTAFKQKERKRFDALNELRKLKQKQKQLEVKLEMQPYEDDLATGTRVASEPIGEGAADESTDAAEGNGQESKTTQETDTNEQGKEEEV